MTIRVQPDEGVYLTINSSVPALTTRTEPIDLDLTYRGREIPEAYEALLLDAIRGDYSRSVREDELDASWKIFTPLLHRLDRDDAEKPREYPYGSLKRFSVPMCLEGWLMRIGSAGPEGLDEFIASYQQRREKAAKMA